MERETFLLPLGALLCFGIVFTRACDLLSVNECTALLSKGTNVNIQNQGISAIPSADTLTEMCSSLTEFRACYDPKAAACSNNTVFSMTFGTIKKTIDFLCEEGFHDIMLHASCWNRTEVVEGQASCHHDQTRQIASLKQHVGHLLPAERRNHWCINILENTTQCMVQTVLDVCGSAPSCTMRNMMNRALEGLTTLMECPKPLECSVQADNLTGLRSTTESHIRKTTHHPKQDAKTAGNTATRNIQLNTLFIGALFHLRLTLYYLYE